MQPVGQCPMPQNCPPEGCPEPEEGAETACPGGDGACPGVEEGCANNAPGDNEDKQEFRENLDKEGLGGKNVINGKYIDIQMDGPRKYPPMSYNEKLELGILKPADAVTPDTTREERLPTDPHFEGDVVFKDDARHDEASREARAVQGGVMPEDPAPKHGEDADGKKLKPEMLGRYAPANMPHLPHLPERPGVKDFENLKTRTGCGAWMGAHNFTSQIEAARHSEGIDKNAPREIRAEPQLREDIKQKIINNPPERIKWPKNGPKPTSWERNYQKVGFDKISSPLHQPPQEKHASNPGNLIPQMPAVSAAVFCDAASQAIDNAQNGVNGSETSVAEENLGKIGTSDKGPRAQFVETMCKAQHVQNMGGGIVAGGAAGAAVLTAACAVLPNPAQPICAASLTQVVAVGIGASVGAAAGAYSSMATPECQEFFGTDQPDNPAPVQDNEGEKEEKKEEGK